MIQADQLSTFMADGSNIVLLLVLIALFIIAYKILQVVVQTMIVAVLSGVFVGVLSYMGLGPEITMRTIVTFMSLGVGLFILFSVLDMATDVLSIVWNVVKRGLNAAGSAIGIGKKFLGSDKSDKRKRDSKNTKASGSKEKSIILEEADDD